MTGERPKRIPGVLYCNFPGCGFQANPNMDGGGYHHTLDNPGHFVSDAPPEVIVEDEDVPISPVVAARLLSSCPEPEPVKE